MNDAAHALISLEQRFAEGILSGNKLVELRRRPMRLAVGTTIWMYAKVPVGRVVGSAQVQSLHTLPPTTIWKRYGDVSGLSKREFHDYFSGLARGFALVLCSPSRLPVSLSLERLRSLDDGFQPPQFFVHLASDGALVSALSEVDTALTATRSRQAASHQLSSVASS